MECGTEGNGIRRLTKKSTPVEHGQHLATSTGTLDRDEMSELSVISIEKTAVKGSPTDSREE